VAHHKTNTALDNGFIQLSDSHHARLRLDLFTHTQLVSKLGSAMPSLNFTSGEDPLSLDRIRSVLVRLEDTIIFSLIERAQFTHNPRMYQESGFKELTELGFKGSWLKWFLKEIESFHGALGLSTSDLKC